MLDHCQTYHVSIKVEFYLKLDPYCRCWFKVSETLAIRFGT